MSEDGPPDGLASPHNPMMEALWAAREGDAERALAALVAECEDRVTTNAEQLEGGLEGGDLDDEQATYQKGRLDESRSVATTARMVQLALTEGEETDGS